MIYFLFKILIVSNTIFNDLLSSSVKGLYSTTSIDTTFKFFKKDSTVFKASLFLRPLSHLLGTLTPGESLVVITSISKLICI